VLRDRNALYREVGDGTVENSYTLKLVNKDQHDNRYRITLDRPPRPVSCWAKAKLHGKADAEQVLSLPLRVSAPDSIRGRHEVRLPWSKADGASAKTSTAASSDPCDDREEIRSGACPSCGWWLACRLAPSSPAWVWWWSRCAPAAPTA
jgi:hypothetical protein